MALYYYVHWWNHFRVNEALNYLTPLGVRVQKLATASLEDESNYETGDSRLIFISQLTEKNSQFERLVVKDNRITNRKFLHLIIFVKKSVINSR